MRQYRTEISMKTGQIMRCAPAYDVAEDGIVHRQSSIVIRYQAETLAEARALAAFYRHRLMKKGEL